jgi:hypothetical protein
MTLDITQSMNASESKFTQQLEKLDDRICIVGRAIGATRSASSIWGEDWGVMHGELYYTGTGYHAWASKTCD